MATDLFVKYNQKLDEWIEAIWTFKSLQEVFNNPLDGGVFFYSFFAVSKSLHERRSLESWFIFQQFRLDKSVVRKEQQFLHKIS